MSRFARRARPFLLAVAISGCASEWTQPGVSEEQFLQDRYECERFTRVGHGGKVGIPLASRDARGAPGFDERLPARSAEELFLFERCMRDRGYRRVKRARN